MEEKNSQNYAGAVKYYGDAISVLEWGLEAWNDVSNDDRGVIFSPTFIRGVKRFFLETYLAVSN